MSWAKLSVIDYVLWFSLNAMEYQQYFSCCFMFAHMHSSCCLDYDPYPFCGGDCLDPCILEWSHYFGGDGLELDAGVVSISDVTCTQSQIAAISKSVPSVQERLKQHESFWLDELEPSSFVAGIITVGYRLPFLRLPDPLFQMNSQVCCRKCLVCISCY